MYLHGVGMAAGGSANHIVRIYNRSNNCAGASKANSDAVGCDDTDFGASAADKSAGSRTYVGHAGTVLAMEVRSTDDESDLILGCERTC